MTIRLEKLTRDELVDFCLLLPQVFSDYRPWRGPLELIYPFSETPDNMDSGLSRAIDLVRSGYAYNLGIPNGPLGHGYAGYDHTMKSLKRLGWHGEVTVIEAGVEGNFNTRTEADALVAWARGRGDIGIVAPAFHLLRTFMTTVTAMGNEYIRVYAYVGDPLEWRGKKIVHSQGNLVKEREGLLPEEFGRLAKYQAPQFGGLVTPAQTLEYLRQRDS